MGGRHLPGPWPSDTLAPSVLSIGVRAQRVELDMEATREAPAGTSGGARPRTAGGRGGGVQPDFSKHGAVLSHPGCPQRSGRPSQGGASSLQGLWLILQPFWASVAAAVKEGRPPGIAPLPPAQGYPGSGWLRGGSGLCKLRLPGWRGRWAGGQPWGGDAALPDPDVGDILICVIRFSRRVPVRGSPRRPSRGRAQGRCVWGLLPRGEEAGAPGAARTRGTELGLAMP